VSGVRVAQIPVAPGAVVGVFATSGVLVGPYMLHFVSANAILADAVNQSQICAAPEALNSGASEVFLTNPAQVEITVSVVFEPYGGASGPIESIETYSYNASGQVATVTNVY